MMVLLHSCGLVEAKSQVTNTEIITQLNNLNIYFSLGDGEHKKGLLEKANKGDTLAEVS